MRVQVLGPLELEHGLPALSPRDRVVLSALLVRLGGPLSADELADALWGEEHPASWLKVVHGCVSRLRRALGPHAIETVPVGYRLRADAVDLDTVEFESLVARGREYAGTGAPERAVTLFEQALALWRGRPFDELDEWSPGLLEAGRLHELRLTVEEDVLQARLDQGDHRAVAASAMVACGEEPWRERRWALLALAQYRGGRQADALSSIRRARGALGNDLGLDPGSELVALERAILAQDPSLAGAHEVRVASAECPWKGLASYATTDQDAFCGRSAEVVAALARIEDHPLLLLTGPSGSGKSSLMLAGMAPALLRRGLEVVSFAPGGDPTVAMSTALLTAGRDPVLLVDQFEEAFTLARPGIDVAGWLAELATYAHTRAPVAITLRADHMADLTREPTFARMAEHGVFLVAPLEGAGLREAIEEPARRVGLRLEQGLVELMMRDTEGQPGALPLLSHALVETWERREHGLLTVEGYRGSGGMRGGVAASAERLYEELSEAERVQLRRLTLRMVSVSDSGDPVRVALPAGMAAEDPSRLRLLDRLVRARLVTTDQTSFELAHESLARAWPRLRGWLDEDAAGQQVVRHLAFTAAEWDALGRPDGELYRGARLRSALDVREHGEVDLTGVERDFLEVSVARAEDAQLAAEQRVRHERQQNRRLRVLLTGVVVLLIASAGVGAVALDRGWAAARDRDRAEVANGRASHESLVGRSLTLRSTNRAAAALLAVEAYRSTPDALAQSALLGSFSDAPGFLGYTELPYEHAHGTTIPGSDRGVIAIGNEVRTVDLDTGELGPLFEHPMADGLTQSVARVSADGSRLAQLVFDPEQVEDCGYFERLLEDDARGCTQLVVFDIATRAPVLGPLVTPFSGGDVAINDDGSLIAVTGGMRGDLATYEVASGEQLGRLEGLPRPDDVYNFRDTGAVEFGGRGQVFLGSMNGPVRVVDARTLAVRRTMPAPPMSSHNFLKRTRSGLVVAAGDRAIVALDAKTGELRWQVEIAGSGDAWPCSAFVVAEAMDRLYCGNSYGQIEERALGTGNLTGVDLDPQLGEIYDLALAGDNELVTFSRGYSRWRLDGSGPISTVVARGMVSAAGYDPSGRYAQVQPRDGHRPHSVVDLVDSRTVATVDRDADATWVGTGVLALRQRDGMNLVDVLSGDTAAPAAGEVEQALHTFAGAGPDRSWAAIETRAGWDVAEFMAASGELTGRSVSVPGFPFHADESTDGARLWVNFFVGGSILDWTDEDGTKGAMFDIATDHSGSVRTAVTAALAETARGETLVASDYAGRLQEFDPKTLDPVATLPGSRGGAHYLAFSDDGRRLIATSRDGFVQLYDSARWQRLGSIASEAPMDSNEGWLRPDGLAVLVNGRLGVAEWTLDPEDLASSACMLAGRNMTHTEWATYMAGQAYRVTCPEYPSA